MKQLRMILALVMAAVLAIGLTSCNKEEPSESFFFSGKYEGVVTFDKLGDGTLPIVAADTEITVLKAGEYYMFKFDKDGIPPLTGVKLQQGDNTLVTLSGDERGVISITKDRLNISYKNEVGRWTVINALRDY